MAHRVVLAAGLCLGLLVGVAQADNGILGDANCDAEVDVLDAQHILQYHAGIIPTVRCPDNADVTGNGEINAIDSLVVLWMDAGLIDALSSSDV